MTKRRGKGGFTLVELAVTLVIMSILFAIAVPNLLGYIHLSQFRRNESCAKTMYLSAESALTYCRTGGEWESFCRRVKDEGVLNRSFDEADGEQKKLSGRIYGIRLDADEYASGELSGDGSLVDELLSQDTYDKSLLNAAICIEIDVESGHVYSVFYGTSCKGLYYGSNALSQPAELSGEWLDMDSRASYDLRRAERLGYYSVQDAVNVVNLDAAKLKITSINLVNGETLSLGWSSSVRAQNRANVYYEVKLYSSADKALLLTIRVPGSALKTGAQPLEVTAEDGTKKNYTFPIEYDQTTGRASLVLDGMMNAQLYSRLAELSAEDEAAFRQSSSTSITRFGGTLAAPAEVYATVQAFPDPNAAYDSGEMYQKSDVIDSNRANTLFGDGTSADGTKCEVKAFRHLSNIRYMNKAAEFSVAARSLDWASDSVRVYGTAAHGALTVSSGTDIGFPSIPELKTGQTLNGAGGLLNRIAAVFTGGNAVSSLRLDDTSIDANAEYLGLFQKNSGTIRGLRLLSPQVDVSSSTLRGVGAVCGYSCGSLEGDSVDGEDARVRAALTAANAEGIGGVAGVIEGNGTTTGLSASGAVTGTLPVSGEARGIGGIAGSLTVTGTAVKNLTSRASVTGNRSAGGIAGYLAGSGQQTRQDLRDCTNEGLVLSSADADKTSLAGRYIGGIVGYAYHASLGGCTSRAGRAADYEYTQADRSRLRGRYVGGIVGYSDGSVLYRCSTGADGYVLGSEYVGGIVGGANEGADKLLLYDGTTRVTANASCVIGNSYVGGIIGRNSGGSVIENCVNTGVAAGYQAYIGGICGANEKSASIVNCASYVSDTDGAVYRRVTGWGATGSYAGGLTGYNGGSIVFDKKSSVSTRSVAGIVVGRDYVGGLVGYNDADGTIDVDYTLIGGSVFASGDCAGGLVGLNASTALLGQTLTVKPASVQGRYYVGGAIGANVVNPDTDITVGSLRVDNSLGSVTAEAFCGGLIGYQRTYTEKDREGRALYDLLPGIAENGDNVPGTVTASTNPHTVTITADANSAGRLSAVSSNMTIRAYAYAGGIVGCGEPQSRMQVVGCLNAGGFDRPADGVFPDSRLKTGVNLAAYLRTQGHEDAAQALSDEPGADTFRVSIVGGIVGVGGENHVIDRCASRGTMNGLDAMGGVVGLNEGLITDCTLSGSMGSATQDYIGGIAGLNVGGRTAGTLENCTSGKNCTVTGRTAVGGIVGYNLSGGRVQNCTGSANVSGTGRVGGIAGENGGVIVLSGAKAGARRAGPVVACDDRAELPVQLSGVDMRLGADEGELVAARAEAQDALALVLALAAEVGNAPRRRDDRFISRLKAEAVVALVQALEPDIGQHRVEAAGLAGADALHVFLERAAVRQAGHAVLALHLMADAVLHVKAHVLGRLADQAVQQHDDEQQHAELVHSVVPVDMEQPVQHERGHAERAQRGERRHAQPELRRGLLAVRAEKHGQHRRHACGKEQMRQRQHIDERHAEQPVRRALREGVGAEQRDEHVGNEPQPAADRVADEMHHRDGHGHEGVEGNDAPGGGVGAVELIQAGIGQAPQAAQQQKDRRVEKAALADAVEAHVKEDQQREHGEHEHDEYHAGGEQRGLDMSAGDGRHRAEDGRVDTAHPSGKLGKGQAERLPAEAVRQLGVRPQAALHLRVLREGVVLVAVEQGFARPDLDAVFHAARAQHLSAVAVGQRVVIQGDRLPRPGLQRGGERDFAPHAVRQLVPAGAEGRERPVRPALMQSGGKEYRHHRDQQQDERLRGAAQGPVFHDSPSVRSFS